MKKNVWIFGTIAGLIITSFALYQVRECYTNPDKQSNDVVGYAGMIAVFSLVFIGMKNYRDKYLAELFRSDRPLRLACISRWLPREFTWLYGSSTITFLFLIFWTNISLTC